MKTLKITTEWILDTLPMSVYPDGNGTITISTFALVMPGGLN